MTLCCPQSSATTQPRFFTIYCNQANLSMAITDLRLPSDIISASRGQAYAARGPLFWQAMFSDQVIPPSWHAAQRALAAAQHRPRSYGPRGQITPGVRRRRHCAAARAARGGAAQHPGAVFRRGYPANIWKAHTATQTVHERGLRVYNAERLYASARRPGDPRWTARYTAALLAAAISKHFAQSSDRLESYETRTGTGRSGKGLRSGPGYGAVDDKAATIKAAHRALLTQPYLLDQKTPRLKKCLRLATSRKSSSSRSNGVVARIQR